jgi:uncharacterized protein
MKISMFAMSVDTCVTNLEMLAKLLDKGLAHATAKKFEPSVLVNARLAPDMFPLSRQVQIACDIAKSGAARLAAQEPPRFEDNETTIEELRQRIDRTVKYLRSIPERAFEGCEDRDIKIPLRERVLEMKGLPYLQGWVLPNFYFHVVATYLILRHNGVELGKGDFLGI